MFWWPTKTQALMHSTSGAWKEYSLQPRWRWCCERICEAHDRGEANAASSFALPTTLRRISRMMRPSRERRQARLLILWNDLSFIALYRIRRPTRGFLQ